MRLPRWGSSANNSRRWTPRIFRAWASSAFQAFHFVSGWPPLFFAVFFLLAFFALISPPGSQNASFSRSKARLGATVGSYPLHPSMMTICLCGYNFLCHGPLHGLVVSQWLVDLPAYRNTGKARTLALCLIEFRGPLSLLFLHLAGCELQGEFITLDRRIRVSGNLSLVWALDEF